MIGADELPYLPAWELAELITIFSKFLSCPSRSPPNCGVVSSTMFPIVAPVANPATSVLLVILFNPPPEVSTARRTSSLATVDISFNDPTATELKLVPSAMRRFPAVFVPIVISSPLTVRSPVIVQLPLAFRVVNDPAPADVPPMVTPSIVPPSIFAVVISIDAITSCSIALFSSALVIFFVTFVLA